MNASNDREPRQPFQGEEFQSPPFYQTPEFRRGVALIALLVVFGLGAWYFMSQHAASVAEVERAKANEAAAQEIVPTHPLTDAEKEARHTAQLTKLEGTLSDTENGQSLTLQTVGFGRLLQLMSRFTPEEIAQRAKVDFDWALVMRDPDAWRGEFLRVRGVLRTLIAIKLEHPIQGHTDFFRGILTDQENFFFVDMLERPTGVAEGDAVDVDAVMYRTVLSVARDDKKHEDPLLVARDMRRVPAAVDTGLSAFLKEHTLPIFAALAFLVLLVVLLFSTVRQAKKHERRNPQTAGSFQELFDKKLREEGKAPPPHA
jgi:hypothetical protein